MVRIEEDNAGLNDLGLGPEEQTTAKPGNKQKGGERVLPLPQASGGGGCCGGGGCGSGGGGGGGDDVDGEGYDDMDAEWEHEDGAEIDREFDAKFEANMRKEEQEELAQGKSGRCCSLRSLLLIFCLLALTLYVAKGKLDDELSGFNEVDVSQALLQDHYQVLGLIKGSKAAEIKQAYRKLSLLYHPDKNQEEEAAEKMRAITLAYSVLGDAVKKEQYDKIDATYEILHSMATTLTAANFDSLVLQSDAVWIIQIYSDWHKACISFAPAWEEMNVRHNKVVRFGRIHIREQALTRRLYYRYGVVPQVISYVRGEFADTKLFLHALPNLVPVLSTWIHAQIPDIPTSLSVQLSPVPNTENIQQAMESIVAFLSPPPEEIGENNSLAHLTRSRTYVLSLPRFDDKRDSKLAPSPLAVRLAAVKYNALDPHVPIRFARLELPGASKHARLGLIKQLKKRFKLPEPEDALRDLLILASEEEGEWYVRWYNGGGELNGLERELALQARRHLSRMDGNLFNRQCVGQPTSMSGTCVILLECEMARRCFTQDPTPPSPRAINPALQAASTDDFRSSLALLSLALASPRGLALAERGFSPAATAAAAAEEEDDREYKSKTSNSNRRKGGLLFAAADVCDGDGGSALQALCTASAASAGVHLFLLHGEDGTVSSSLLLSGLGPKNIQPDDVLHWLETILSGRSSSTGTSSSSTPFIPTYKPMSEPLFSFLLPRALSALLPTFSLYYHLFVSLMQPLIGENFLPPAPACARVAVHWAYLPFVAVSLMLMTMAALSGPCCKRRRAILCSRKDEVEEEEEEEQHEELQRISKKNQ